MEFFGIFGISWHFWDFWDFFGTFGIFWDFWDFLGFRRLEIFGIFRDFYDFLGFLGIFLGIFWKSVRDFFEWFTPRKNQPSWWNFKICFVSGMRVKRKVFIRPAVVSFVEHAHFRKVNKVKIEKRLVCILCFLCKSVGLNSIGKTGIS